MSEAYRPAADGPHGFTGRLAVSGWAFVQAVSWRLAPLVVGFALCLESHGAEPRVPSSFKLSSPALWLAFDDGTAKRSPESGDWTEFFDTRSQLPVARAYQVEMTEGYRGKGLGFNGKSSHVNTNVPLAEVRTVALWLCPHALDEPFYLLNFHAATTGFSVSSAGDNNTLTLSWFADDKWQTVSFDHGLQSNRWHHIVLSIDWAAGRLLSAIDGTVKDPLRFRAFDGEYPGKLAVSTSWQDKAFKGVIDDLQVSATRLSPEQLQGLFDSSERVADWPNPSPNASLRKADEVSPLDTSIVASPQELLGYSKALLLAIVNDGSVDLQKRDAIDAVARQFARFGRERDVLELLELVRSSEFHRDYSRLRCDAACAAAEADNVALAVRLRSGLESNLRARAIAQIGIAQVRKGQKQSALSNAEDALLALDTWDAGLSPAAAEDIAYLLTRLGRRDLAVGLANRFQPPNLLVVARVVQAQVASNDLDAAEATNLSAVRRRRRL